MAAPRFSAGINLAMKIPRADYDATVSFYREVLGFEVTQEEETGAPSVSRSHRVRFGPNTLWLDCVDSYSRSDIWLELFTDDLEAATTELAEAGTGTCDELEVFSDPRFRGHWIKNPAGVVHLLAERD